MDVDRVADELYELDPAEFVRARTEWVERARAAKDRDAAKAVSGLKKPTVVGWLVNLLARERPGEIDAILSLGDALRTAQRRLDPQALRELTAQRQRLVRVLAARAGELAARRGRSVGEAALRDVAQTLHAAMADPELAQSVRRGRILGAASYSGFGPASLESVGAAAGSEGGQEVGDGAEGDSSAARAELDVAARAELDAARADEAAARDVSAARDHEHARAAADLTALTTRLTELDRERSRVEEQADFARRAERAAGEAAEAAREELRRALDRVGQAEAAVDGP